MQETLWKEHLPLSVPQETECNGAITCADKYQHSGDAEMYHEVNFTLQKPCNTDHWQRDTVLVLAKIEIESIKYLSPCAIKKAQKRVGEGRLVILHGAHS